MVQSVSEKFDRRMNQAWCGRQRHGSEGQGWGMVGLGLVRSGRVWLGMVRQGFLDSVMMGFKKRFLCGQVRMGKVRLGGLGSGRARSGLVRSG